MRYEKNYKNPKFKLCVNSSLIRRQLEKQLDSSNMDRGDQTNFLMDDYAKPYAYF
jgi:hypothetical protein